MNTRLDPLVSEFDTDEQAASHERWFKKAVQASLDDSQPSIPHDEVMAEMRELVAKKRP